MTDDFGKTHTTHRSNFAVIHSDPLSKLYSSNTEPWFRWLHRKKTFLLFAQHREEFVDLSHTHRRALTHTHVHIHTHARARAHTYAHTHKHARMHIHAHKLVKKNILALSTS